LTFEPQHISLPGWAGIFLLDVLRSKGTKSVKQWSWHSGHRACALRSRYARDPIHRMDQTAHKSLQSPAMSKSGETKTDRGASFLWGAPACSISRCLFRLVALAWCRRPVWRPVGASAPPVKGYLRMRPGGRKGFF